MPQSVPQVVRGVHYGLLYRQISHNSDSEVPPRNQHHVSCLIWFRSPLLSIY